MTSHILHAVENNLRPCPRCKAERGDPCRTPSWRTRAPHVERYGPPKGDKREELCALCGKGFVLDDPPYVNTLDVMSETWVHIECLKNRPAPPRNRDATRSAKVQAERKRIERQLKAIECDVCGTRMGYVEADEAPAAICSDECVRIQAERCVKR